MTCAKCGKPLPELSVMHGDAFCTTECAKAFYGVKIAEKAKTTRRGYTYEPNKTAIKERASDDGIPHGTENGYVNYACRCRRCRAATTDARSRRRERII